MVILFKNRLEYYIDTETFAVLKYEHCVVREPSEIKNQKDKMAQMLHKIIFTYKIHEVNIL
jgi:hypothetical protein